MILPILVALASFHVPVSCDLQPPPGRMATATGAYLAARTPNGLFATDGRIQLAPTVCVLLDRSRRDRSPSAAEASALMTLGHELAHSYGIVNEAGAVCVGVNLIGLVADHLGLSARFSQLAYATALNSQTDISGADGCSFWDQAGDPWTSTPANDPYYENG